MSKFLHVSVFCCTPVLFCQCGFDLQRLRWNVSPGDRWQEGVRRGGWCWQVPADPRGCCAHSGAVLMPAIEGLLTLKRGTESAGNIRCLPSPPANRFSALSNPTERRREKHERPLCLQARIVCQPTHKSIPVKSHKLDSLAVSPSHEWWVHQVHDQIHNVDKTLTWGHLVA